MPEYNKSICRSCFHSYVCEEFNADRDSNNKKCHYFNDHYVSAADVVEVVQGEWIEKPFLLGTSNFCSVCDSFYGMPHGKFNYCPNCGADMRRDTSG